MGRLLSAPTAYQDALDYLFRRTTGAVRLGLERTHALLAELGDPQQRVPSVHIAGTNGKGSTAATVEALLREQGLRVGKYTSPHLVDFGERIVVDGVPLDPARVVAFVADHLAIVERLGATFFEATTALAFASFAEAAVDIAVIETGLGGRLDSTNVIRPLVAAVTSIGIDHVEFLGTTTAEIAREKAGIFKVGVPAVIGESDGELAELLATAAREVGASPVRLLRDAGWPREVEVANAGTAFTVERQGRAQRLRTPLVGAHQAANAAVALAICDLIGPGPAQFSLGPERLQVAFDRIQIPGRFQRVGRYILDVAHNPAGVETLARTLAALAPPRPIVALLAVLSDKDWRGIMAALAPWVDAFVLTTAPTAPVNRRWDLSEAANFAEGQGWPTTVVHEFDDALAHAGARAATIVVTGSFHTVGDALLRLPRTPSAR